MGFDDMSVLRLATQEDVCAHRGEHMFGEVL